MLLIIQNWIVNFIHMYPFYIIAPALILLTFHFLITFIFTVTVFFQKRISDPIEGFYIFRLYVFGYVNRYSLHLSDFASLWQVTFTKSVIGALLSSDYHNHAVSCGIQTQW